MEKRNRRVGVREYNCNGQKLYSYFTVMITIAPKLKQCKKCEELFIYNEDDELYGKSLKEEIKSKNCPTCLSKLSDTLIDYKFDKSKLSCLSPEIVVKLDVFIDIYELYS